MILTDRDLEALTTWILFDQEFVDLNRSDPLQSFEVATALRRISFANLVAGRRQQATKYVREVIAIFVRLETEFPASISYRIDHAATRLQLAELLGAADDIALAVEQCDQAVKVLQVEQTFATGEFDHSVPEVLDAAAELLLQLGAKERAAAITQTSSEIREILAAKYATDPSDRPKNASSIRIQ